MKFTTSKERICLSSDSYGFSHKGGGDTLRLLRQLENLPALNDAYFILKNCGVENMQGSPLCVAGMGVHGSTITSLLGSPIICANSFLATATNLSTLEGGPLYVGGEFSLLHNSQLTSLIGSPYVVGGCSFDLSSYAEPLTSLVGMPAYVDRRCSIIGTGALHSLEGLPKYIGGSLSISRGILQTYSSVLTVSKIRKILNEQGCTVKGDIMAAW